MKTQENAFKLQLFTVCKGRKFTRSVPDSFLTPVKQHLHHLEAAEYLQALSALIEGLPSGSGVSSYRAVHAQALPKPG